MLTFLVRTLTVFLAASNAFTDEPLQTQDGPLAIVTVESLTLKDSDGKCAFEWKSAAEERGVSQAKEYAW